MAKQKKIFVKIGDWGEPVAAFSSIIKVYKAIYSDRYPPKNHVSYTYFARVLTKKGRFVYEKSNLFGTKNTIESVNFF